jgi:hypothetical protein
MKNENSDSEKSLSFFIVVKNIKTEYNTYVNCIRIGGCEHEGKHEYRSWYYYH